VELLLTLVRVQVGGITVMMEYSTFVSDSLPNDEQLNDLSVKGWELIVIVNTPGSLKENVYVSYFAREADEKQSPYNRNMIFFSRLTIEEQLIILECAAAGLRDELSDAFLRNNEVLDLDLSYEVLEPILDKLARFMEGDR